MNAEKFDLTVNKLFNIFISILVYICIRNILFAKKHSHHSDFFLRDIYEKLQVYIL